VSRTAQLGQADLGLISGERPERVRSGHRPRATEFGGAGAAAMRGAYPPASIENQPGVIVKRRVVLGIVARY
jgi:hypothetical protein